MKSCTRQLLAGLLLFATGSSLANALTINATFDSSFSSDPNAVADEATVESAITNIEADLANPVVVDLTVSDMNSGLGESNGDFYTTSYSSYYSSLSNQIQTSQDKTAIASLGSNTAVNPVNGDSNMLIAGALLEALQTNVQGAGALTTPVNASLGLNVSITNANTGTQNPDNYSLQSVTAHELDEILGIGGAGSNLPTSGALTGIPVGVMDLYRYSAPGTRSFTYNTSTGAYFSINGGATNLVNFNRVAGADYGDWGDGTPSDQNGNTPPQVQDAYGTPGVKTALGVNELTALDVVGWNLTAQGLAIEDAPEPSAYAMMLVGVGLVGFCARRKLA